MSKGFVVPVGVIALILIIAVAVVGFDLIPGELITSSSTFVKPQWSRLECAPTDTFEGRDTMHVNKGGRWIDCGVDEFTDGCQLFIDTTNPSFWSNRIDVKYTVCTIGGSCGAEQKLTLIEGTIDRKLLDSTEWEKGETVFIRFESVALNIDKEGDVTKKWRPWKLYRFDGGAKLESKATDCCLTSGLFQFIPTKENVPSCLTMTGGIGSKWVNFVSDWVYGPPTNVYTHTRHGEVYCTGAKLYDIVTLQMEDSSFKKIDPVYQKPGDAPTYVKSIGRILESVECCPSEPFCGDDFKFHIKEEASCWTDAQCFNAGNPIPVDSKHYKVEQCVDGKCLLSVPIEVECTTTAQCGSGQICDLSSTNYGRCIFQEGDSYCGDKRCDRTESQLTCPADCGQISSGLAWRNILLAGIITAIAGLIGLWILSRFIPQLKMLFKRPSFILVSFIVMILMFTLVWRGVANWFVAMIL